MVTDFGALTPSPDTPDRPSLCQILKKVTDFPSAAAEKNDAMKARLYKAAEHVITGTESQRQDAIEQLDSITTSGMDVSPGIRGLADLYIGKAFMEGYGVAQDDQKACNHMALAVQTTTNFGVNYQTKADTVPDILGKIQDSLMVLELRVEDKIAQGVDSQNKEAQEDLLCEIGEKIDDIDSKLAVFEQPPAPEPEM